MSTLAEIIEDDERLDRAVAPVAARVGLRLTGTTKDVLNGSWLGHPAHPMLTDLPIGSWTSAFVLDVFGGRRSRRAADGLVALGIVTALPTAATGLADWLDLNRRGRRVGVVHAAANLVGVALYTCSLKARLRGRRGRGVALGVVAAGALTVGGYLGGHLAFGLKDEPNDGQAAEAPPSDGRAALPGAGPAEQAQP